MSCRPQDRKTERQTEGKESTSEQRRGDKEKKVEKQKSDDGRNQRWKNEACLIFHTYKWCCEVDSDTRFPVSVASSLTESIIVFSPFLFLQSQT